MIIQSFKKDLKELQEIYKNTCIKIDQLEQSGKTIYPPKIDRLNSLKYISINNIKVVIIAQDPYHGPDQAH